jgi:hypothetical protein
MRTQALNVLLELVRACKYAAVFNTHVDDVYHPQVLGLLALLVQKVLSLLALLVQKVLSSLALLV